jgi:PAS domain S-box-containing protein
VQYSLKALRETILKQWWRTLWYAGATVIGVLTLLTLMLRSPMLALRQTTEFSRRLGSEMGSSIPVYTGTVEISSLTIALNALSQQLNAQEKALADRIAQNQSILDNVVDGILTIDTRGQIRSFNKAATQIFGYAIDEIVGQSVNILMPEPFSSRHDGYMQTYAETGVAKVVGIGRETEAVRKDGTIFPIDLAISRTSDKGEIIFIGIVRDITERRRLDRLKSEFVSTVSHELRTPLTSIHGSLKLLEGGVAGALPPAATQLLGVAQKSSQRLILLINDLLDMEKLAAGKMTMNLAQVDLTEIVKQSIQDNFGYASTHNVRFILGAHPDQLKVTADPARLAQVLANLLSNAAKFSAGAPQVDIEVVVDEDAAKVKVTDHGVGIPDDFKNEIFGAFAQANNGNTRKQGGTGLGLKISKGLILTMKGEIGFDTQAGAGTTFWFALPLSVSDEPDAAS